MKNLLWMSLLFSLLAACGAPPPTVASNAPSSAFPADKNVEIVSIDGPILVPKPASVASIGNPVNSPVGMHRDDHIKNLFLLKLRALHRGNELPKNDTYGMVIFTAKPSTPEQLTLFQQVCRTWNSTFVSTEEAGAILAAKSFITYWPIVDSSSCHSEDTYNYLVADLLVQNLGITRKGAFLLMVHGDKYITMDIGVLVPADIPRAFNTWKSELRVAEDGSWNSLFNLVVLREKFRYYLNTYGNAVLNLK